MRLDGETLKLERRLLSVQFEAMSSEKDEQDSKNECEGKSVNAKTEQERITELKKQIRQMEEQLTLTQKELCEENALLVDEYRHWLVELKNSISEYPSMHMKVYGYSLEDCKQKGYRCCANEYSNIQHDKDICQMRLSRAEERMKSEIETERTNGDGQEDDEKQEEIQSSKLQSCKSGPFNTNKTLVKKKFSFCYK